MTKKKVYVVARGTSILSLEEVVAAYILDGYKPIGGVSVITDHYGIECFQALTPA